MKKPVFTWITAACLLVLCMLLLSCRSELLSEPMPESSEITEQETTAISSVSVSELKDKLDNGSPIVLVDVRNEDTYLANHIDKAVSIPLDEIPDRYSEIPQDTEVIIYSGCA